MKDHLESRAKNATYTSSQIQTEIICGHVIKDDIIYDSKKAYAYSILACISGKEQLSISIKYFDEEKMVICKKFLGFAELVVMDAKSIACTIDNFILGIRFESDKFIGQGYGGCSTMSSKDGGIQKIMREKYRTALFFHSASHKLNLVVNDLNKIADTRNIVGTIKEIIKFFRESPLRRKHVPNITMLCDTHWSQYASLCSKKITSKW